MTEIKPLKREGDFVEKQLKSIIVKRDGKPDRLAIEIYSRLKGWFQPNKNNRFKKTGKLDIREHGFRTSYEELAKEHNCSKELVRQKIVLLEELGLGSRDFRIEYAGGIRKNNVLHLLIWKETPYFKFEHGLEKRPVFDSNINKETWYTIEKESATPSKKLGVAPPTNKGGSLQQTLDIINSNTTPHTTPHKTDNHDYQENQSINFNFSFSEKDDDSFYELNEKFLDKDPVFEPEEVAQQQVTIHQFNPLKDRVSFTDKNGNTYWGIPIAKFKYSRAMIEQVRVGSNKPHFAHERIVGLLSYLATKDPDKLIIGGKAGFISYMIKVVNGEFEYTEKEKLESIEDKRKKAVAELDRILAEGNQIQWA